MYPDPLFSIGKFSVHLYGICIAIGIICTVMVLRTFGKKLKVDNKFLDFVELNAYLSIGVGFFSSALFQAVYNYIADPSAGFDLFGGGITFIGGLIGGAATFLVIYFIRKNKYESSFKDIISIVPPCILIAHAFGRVGCFFAGCCYGIQTDSWLGVSFPNVVGKVYPTQLFEAIFLFILFGITALLSWKKDYKHNFSIYLVFYGLFRFLIEYIRGDDRGAFVGGISPSQFWSLLMIAIGIGLYFFVEKVYLKKQLFKKNETALDE